MTPDQLPIGPVSCPGCGWDDHGELELVDVEATFAPPIPSYAYPSVAVFGDEGRRRHECPGCEHELDPFTVVARFPTPRKEVPNGVMA